ncbi:hypothetical protein ACQRCW_05410, partial [Desulfovibrio sp. SGI.082]|uniref:hypothetical protein n=1 Tax=Desulfovibrio sp. SGI.082 TaxID=3420558 RepID=UPI003D027E5A
PQRVLLKKLRQQAGKLICKATKGAARIRGQRLSSFSKEYLPDSLPSHHHRISLPADPPIAFELFPG